MSSFRAEKGVESVKEGMIFVSSCKSEKMFEKCGGGD
jgi:hypothetical protein